MRNRIIIIAVALILVIGVSLGIIYAVNRSPKLQNVVYKVSQTTPPTNTAVTNATVIPAPPKITADQQAVQFLARNFTEQYGSFSNQNGGSNLRQAAQYATVAYAEDLNKQAANKLSAPAAKEYNGVITKALVFTFVKMNTTSASMVVSTQQAVTTGASTTTATKDILLDFIKVGADWKVSAAVWK